MPSLKSFRFVFIVVLFLHTACSSTEDPAKKELKWYLDAVQAPFNLESEAIEAFNAVSGDNYQSDKVMLEVIRGQVLPKLREFKKAMKGIDPVTNEVSGLNRMYLEVIDLHIKAFEALEDALVQGSEARLDEWRALISQRGIAFKRWDARLKKMSEKYK